MKHCPDCQLEKETSSFGKETANKDGLRTICKPCNSMRALKWHNNNKEHVNARERAAHKKNPSKNSIKNKRWRENNPEKTKILAKKAWEKRDKEKTKKTQSEWINNNKDKVSANSKKSYNKNKEKGKPTRKKWEQENRGKRRAIVAKRRAIKIQATPKWLSEEDFNKIESFYVLAANMTQKTGIVHEVDHILPLNGNEISGLHYWTNLQILTAEQNRSKSNRIAPEIIGIFPDWLVVI